MTSARLHIVDADWRAYTRVLEARALPDLEIVAAHAYAPAEPPAADIVLGQPDQVRRLLRAGARPRWVQSTWAGVDGLFGDPVPQDMQLTGIKGVFGPKIAEYVFAYVLAHHRKVIRRWLGERDRRWQQTATDTLEGRRMTIVGTGDIGSHIAKVAQAFGLRVAGVSRSGRSRDEFAAMHSPGELGVAVSDADYVVNVLPATLATANLFAAPTFAAMPARAVFINVGRGSTVDEEALLNALGKGKIAAAVLDVFKEEPLPSEHPFWSMDNVRVTSHTAGITPPESVVDLFQDNYRRYRAGEPLRRRVDLEAGY